MILRKALAAACCLLASLGFAQTKYAIQSKTINVATVLLANDINTSYSPNQLNNWTPFVWYNLDLDTLIKPAGWSFDNPGHATTLVASYSRWNTITGGNLPGMSTRLSKNMAPYWEIQLGNLTDAQIAQYNMLLISAHGTSTLTVDEAMKLKKFMDEGGIVWVDVDNNTALDIFNTFPLPFTFGSALGPTSFFANFQDPLLSFPNGITLTDLGNMTGPNPLGGTGALAGISALSQSNYSSFAILSGGSGYSGNPLAASLWGDSERLNTVYGIFGTPITDSIISAGQVGDGYEVVTTNDVATLLGNGEQNTFAAGIPSYNVDNNAAAKLVTNMAELTAQDGQNGKGGRKMGTSTADIGAPLITQWHDGTSYALTASSYSYEPPVAYKDLLVITTPAPNSQILVYDGNPIESLSGNGNSDDGIPDFSLGTSYDLVFESTVIPTAISSATCIDAPNASGTSGTPVEPIMPDQIWVEDSTGRMLEWNAFGHFNDSTQGAEPPDHIVDPSLVMNLGAAEFDPGAVGGGPYAPTFQDGLLFVTDTVGPSPYNGRIWIVDPLTPDQPLMSNSQLSAGSSPWVCGGNQWHYNAGVSGPSTVGYVPATDDPGAADRVVYVPMQPSSANSTTCGIVSEWFGTKGETWQLQAGTGSFTITPRCEGSKNLVPYFPSAADLAADPTLQGLAPKITLIDFNGNPSKAADLNSMISSITYNSGSSVTGTITINLNTGSPVYGNYVNGLGQITVRIDYTVDWSNLGAANSDYSRGSMNFPDDVNRQRRIVDNVALGPNGIMYVVASTTNPTGDLTHPPGGSFYEIAEEGPGNFTVLNRWSLYDQHTENPAGELGVTVPPALENVDPLISIFSSLGNQIAVPSNPSLLQDLTFTSGPVVSNGVVYVTAQGDNGATPPVVDTILLAFNAQPPPLTINVSNVTAGFTLLQPDLDEAQTRSNPTSNWILPSTLYNFVSGPLTDIGVGTSGTNTSNGVIYITSLTTPGGGQQIAGCFSTSQPVILRQIGSPDQVLYPSASGSHWSPLLWYTVLTGSGLPPTGTINSTSTRMGPPFVSGSTVYVPTSNPTVSLLYNGGGSYPGTPYGMVYGISTTISSTDPYLISDPVHPWQTQLAELNGGSSPISLTNIVPNPDFLWPQLAGVTTTANLAIRLSQATLGPLWNLSESTPPAQATTALGVVGGNGRLFSWSDLGVYGFERANIYVADANRVISSDSVGNPLWSTDQTQNLGSNGSVGTVHKLVTPCRAYSTNSGQVLVVDPGSNRLAILDQTAQELRSIDSFSVDPGYIPQGYAPGEPTKFSAPRDVQIYTSVVSAANNTYTTPAPAGTEYWVHYLIADSGNQRIVDIVDRYVYDSAQDGPGYPVEYNGAPVQGVLYWQTPATVSGSAYSYTSVARVYDPTITNGATTGGWVIAAGVGNTSVSNVLQSSAGSSATGGIILFPLVTGAGPIQISTVAIPPLTGNLIALTSELAGAFSATSPLLQRNIGAVNSLTAKYFIPNGASSPTLSLLYTDQTGVYEINAGTPGTTLSGLTWTVDWMLPRTLPISVGGTNSNSLLEAPVYSVMRRDTVSDAPTTDNPLDFVPTFAERTPSGDILITNGYAGRYRKATSLVDSVSFTGEILELDPTTYSTASENLGFNTATIKLVLSTLNGARAIVQPLFADRR